MEWEATSVLWRTEVPKIRGLFNNDDEVKEAERRAEAEAEQRRFVGERAKAKENGRTVEIKMTAMRRGSTRRSLAKEVT